jgi:hypothetical protein
MLDDVLMLTSQLIFPSLLRSMREKRLMFWRLRWLKNEATLGSVRSATDSSVHVTPPSIFCHVRGSTDIGSNQLVLGANSPEEPLGNLPLTLCIYSYDHSPCPETQRSSETRPSAPAGVHHGWDRTLAPWNREAWAP